MNRFSEAHFTNWLSKPQPKPIILRGARQVGKSTLIRQIAQSGGFTLYEVNLERHTGLESVFRTMNPQRILKEIELALRKGPIDAPRSILFIDEIQGVPDAIAALRYIHEDFPELPVIAAGSLLEFTLADHTFSMPVGRVDYYHLGPMSFCEFLVASGETSLVDYMKGYQAPPDFSTVAHERLLNHLRDFLFIGGMPEAVETYIRMRNTDAVTEVHRSIMNTYQDDFAKYGGKTPLPHLRRVFEYVPAAVGRKLVFSKVNSDWKAKDIRHAVDLLAQAAIIHRVHHTSGAGVPLSAFSDDSLFKPLFLDVGLMNMGCGAVPLTLEEFNSHRFLHEGALAEQFIGQHLLRNAAPQARPELFYWVREGKSTNAEVDYLQQAGTHVVPVEVKAGTGGSLRSLHQFVATYNTPVALRFDMNPPSVQDVRHTISTPEGQKEIAFTLVSMPLYQVEYAMEVVKRML